MPQKTMETLATEINHAVAEQYLPELLDEMKAQIEAAIQKYIGDELLGQEVDFDVVTQFEITTDTAGGHIEVDVGIIRGEHEVEVTDHKRGGIQVRGYSRTLTDKKAFLLKSGEWVTLDTIPDEIIQEIITKTITDNYEVDSADVEFEE
tara:strand:+ start:819 stop:1265 length:447 start_codon:yes stop_codon:yes gene_type:complete